MGDTTGPVEGVDYEWDDCQHCDGTGHDDGEFDGWCIYCDHGHVKRWYDRDEDYP